MCEASGEGGRGENNRSPLMALVANEATSLELPQLYLLGPRDGLVIMTIFTFLFHSLMLTRVMAIGDSLL